MPSWAATAGSYRLLGLAHSSTSASWMTSVTAEMGKDKFSEATEKALRKCKGIPDSIVDKGPKKDRVIRILAKDTEDMLAKLEEIL